MAENESAQSASTQAWPLPSFYFKVSISNVGDISCSEVSGLETEYEEITYRAGDSPVFTKLKMHIPADTRSAFPVISVQSPVSIQCCWQS